MKLSIVILNWNDQKVIVDCLRSIYASTHSTEFEIIVSDNGSTDGSVDYIRKNFPNVRLLENGANLRFAKGNNVAIRVSTGEYVLILNPDTIIHEGTLDRIIVYADSHPEAGGFGCRILNADGSYQNCIRPLFTLRSEWCAALGLGPLAYISEWFSTGYYAGWKGDTERAVGWPAGCFILVRGDLLRRLDGFDEQFFYYYEDTDLCRRIWEAGYPILYTPDVSITHLGGQSTNKKFPPLGFALDGQVTRYLYYYKYYGARGARGSRRSILVSLFIRKIIYGIAAALRPTPKAKERVTLLRQLFDWNIRVDPIRLVKYGEEPTLGGIKVQRVMDR